MPASDGGGVPVQVPPTHSCPVAQARPQPPQWRTSLVKLTHAPPQSICPLGHVGGASGRGITTSGGGGEPAHMPAVHAAPPAQALLQRPQWAALVARLTHIRSHSAWPAGHGEGRSIGACTSAPIGTSLGTGASMHMPAEHVRPAGQVRPQPPQCAALVLGSTQRRSHSSCIGGHGAARSSGGRLVSSGNDPRSTCPRSVGRVFTVGREPSVHEATRPTRTTDRSVQRMGVDEECTRQRRGLTTRRSKTTLYEPLQW